MKLKNLIFLFFYEILIYCFFCYLKLVGLLTKTKNRFLVNCRNKPMMIKEQFIWVHASSVGESITSFNIVSRLLSKYSSYRFIITTNTASSKALWQHRFSKEFSTHKIIHQYLWLDRKKYVNIFMRIYNPKVALWMEADFWPNYLLTLSQKRIPVILLNGRLSKKSYKRWSLAKGILRQIISFYCYIVADSISSKLRFEKLLINNQSNKPPILYVGNLKYMAPKLKVLSNELSLLSHCLKRRVAIVYVSTHEGEELMAASIHLELKQSFPSLLTIIIPRHIERVEEIRKTILAKHDVKISKFSKQEHIPIDNDICLVDQFAKVDLFCSLVKIVYIGKSMFKQARGGHNLLEPIRNGCVTLFGPFMDKFIDIVTLCIQLKASIMAPSPEVLTLEIKKLLTNEDLVSLMSKKALEVSESKQAMTTKVMGVIESYLS